MRKSGIGLLALLCASATMFAQEKPSIKYGKITPQDFTVVSPVIDSSTNAVVIADMGVSDIEGSTKGWFKFVYKRHCRIKILNQKGFDAAAITIPLYFRNGDEEKMIDLKATTYNLENGNVVATKLQNKDVFEEKQKNYRIKKFTLPAVKAGSIIEYTYSIHSDFLFNLQPWEFQGSYPRLWSQYEVGIPDFLAYVYLSQGYQPYVLDTKSETSKSFTVSDLSSGTAASGSSFSSPVMYHTWAMKDVPALKEESFTSTIANHISKIEFQLSQYRFPNQPVEQVMENWPKVGNRFREREDFGVAYLRPNVWLNDELKTITAGATTYEEKARRIYAFVRDNFVCQSDYGIVLHETSLREVFRKKAGSVSDINLLLLAMLRHESIQAEPVLLSLRERGIVHPIYPLLDRFNYLICQVNLPEATVYLDASTPMLGFNKLPVSCYNGTAWVLSQTPQRIELSPDSIKESRLTSIMIGYDEKGMLKGTVNAVLGDRKSYSIRSRVSRSGKEDYLKELQNTVGGEISISNLGIDSLKQFEEPVSVHYDLACHFNDADVIYFDPLLGDGMKKNPFTSAERFYPIEMPYTMSEVYVLSMDIPKGYIVDEIPKSIRMRLNESDGLFEYIIQKTDNSVQLRCSILISKAVFPQEDYQALRDFFAMVIKKQGEQVVFKKSKS